MVGKESPIGRHIPKAEARTERSDQALVEKTFEKVRQAKYPDRPSRFNCVYVCEGLGGSDAGDYCDATSSYSTRSHEFYEVKVHPGANIFRTNAEIYTEAVQDASRMEDNLRKGYEVNQENLVERIADWAEDYWRGIPDGSKSSATEVLISPPEAAIVIKKHDPNPEEWKTPCRWWMDDEECAEAKKEAEEDRLEAEREAAQKAEDDEFDRLDRASKTPMDDYYQDDDNWWK